jgi:hypothetical protein
MLLGFLGQRSLICLSRRAILTIAPQKRQGRRAEVDMGRKLGPLPETECRFPLRIGCESGDTGDEVPVPPQKQQSGFIPLQRQDGIKAVPILSDSISVDKKT